MTLSGEGVAHERGQSEVLGIVLLFGIVLVVSFTVVVTGANALDDARAATDTENAGITLSEFQAIADEVSSGGESPQTVSFAESQSASAGQAERANVEGGNEGSATVNPDAGHVKISVNGDSILPDDDQVQLGSLEYTRNDQTLVYQGGGVFTKNADSESSAVVSQPPFSYQNDGDRSSLSFPIRTVSGDASGTEFQLEHGDSTRHLPTGGVPNPTGESDTLRIEIQSEYYQAWASVFEEQTGGSVTTDPDNNRAILELNGPDSPEGPIRQAVFGAEGSAITNVGAIDSYDSSNGGYPDSLLTASPSNSNWPYQENGNVRIDGDLAMTSSPTIAGDLAVAGDFSTTNDPVIYGDTRIGSDPGTGDPTVINNNPEFMGDFSTTDDIRVVEDQSQSFGGDVIVGGSVQGSGGSGAVFGGSMIQGSLYIHGTVPKMTTDQIQGDVNVGQDLNLDHDGDTVDIQGDVFVAGDVHIGDQVTFTGSGQTIHAGGDVIFHDGASYDVDVVAGGTVEVGPSSGGSPTVNGDIDAGGDVHVRGDVSGTIVAAGSIHEDGDGDGDSDPSWTGGGSPSTPESVTLPTPPEPDIPSIDSVEPEIVNARSFPDATDSDLAQGTVSEIEGWNGCDTNPCVIEGAGQYGFDQMQIVDGATLRLKPEGGTIEIYVDDHLNLQSNIEVDGDGQVIVYADESSSNNPTIADSLRMDITSDDASQFRVYVHPDETIDTWGDPQFTGVINGAGSTSAASVELTNEFTIRGAIIADVTDMNSNPRIHFDKNLVVESGGGGVTSGPGTVSFIQVSTTEVEVSN